jgi:hypothetical protein
LNELLRSEEVLGRDALSAAPGEKPRNRM